MEKWSIIGAAIASITALAVAVLANLTTKQKITVAVIAAAIILVLSAVTFVSSSKESSTAAAQAPTVVPCGEIYLHVSETSLLKDLEYERVCLLEHPLAPFDKDQAKVILDGNARRIVEAVKVFDEQIKSGQKIFENEPITQYDSAVNILNEINAQVVALLGKAEPNSQNDLINFQDQAARALGTILAELQVNLLNESKSSNI